MQDVDNISRPMIKTWIGKIGYALVPHRFRQTLRRVPTIERLVKRALPATIADPLKSALAAKERQDFIRRDVVHSYAGWPLRVVIADRLAEQWYDRDWEPLPEIEALRKGRLGRGALVFDIGAHQAVVAMMLARIVGTDGRVVAVEASSHDYAVACENARLNDIQQLEIVRAAAAGAAGELAFRLSGKVARQAESWGVETVRAVTLDELALQHGYPDVLFVDVEGYEQEVLSGASAVLERLPDCYVELHAGELLDQFGGSVDRVLSFFPDESYEVVVADGKEATFAPVDRSHLPTQRSLIVAIARRSAGEARGSDA